MPAKHILAGAYYFSCNNNDNNKPPSNVKLAKPASKNTFQLPVKGKNYQCRGEMNSYLPHEMNRLSYC